MIPIPDIEATAAAAPAKAAIPFAHLHVHTEFSLLDGASRIPDLIAAAKAEGMEAIAITDHGAMYGVIDFYKEAKKQGIKPIIGCEVYVAPGDRHERAEVNGVKYYHLILLAENQTGYRNLVKLVSYANIEGFYYKPRVDHELLRKYHEGIICLSACVAGEVPRALIADNPDRADALVREYIDIFGKENYFLEIQNHGLDEEKKSNAREEVWPRPCRNERQPLRAPRGQRVPRHPALHPDVEDD